MGAVLYAFPSPWEGPECWQAVGGPSPGRVRCRVPRKTLLVSVTAAATPHERRATGVAAPAVEALDRALFTTPTFTLNEANERVTAHRTVALARAAVGAGRAATWVATVRRGVVAVDVDLNDDDEAAAVLSAVITWCDEHSVWSLARRSGGGAGRWHLFAVPAELEPALLDVVESTRRTHRLSARQVDVRTQVRPLGAPHRLTGESGVPDDVEHAARDLAAALRQPVGAPSRSRRATEEVAPRAALAHPRQALPPRFWEDVARPHARGTDRSAAEFEFTAQMARAGYSEQDAWSVVAHPAHAGMARSRRRGRAWWRHYSWNAVEVVDATPLARRTGLARTLWSGAYDWSAVVLPAAAALRERWHAWSTRQRHSVDHLLAVIADRFTRNGLEPLPLSLRSLVEDSGLAIGTCRSGLSLLVEVGLLERLPVEDNADGTRAHVYALNHAALTEAVVVDTPSSYTPPPSDPLWVGSPTSTLSHWLSLHVHGPAHTPTRHQAEHSAPWLHARGLLTKDGTPTTREKVSRPRAGLRRWKELRSRHAHERQAFRAFLRDVRSAARARWENGRHRARERQAARDVRRHHHWWASLTEAERTARTQHCREWWQGLTDAERARRRAALDDRRALAGAWARRAHQ